MKERGLQASIQRITVLCNMRTGEFRYMYSVGEFIIHEQTLLLYMHLHVGAVRIQMYDFVATTNRN